VFSHQLHFDHLQCAEKEEREKAACDAETNLSAAETQADHGYKPERGGGCESLDIVAAFQDGSAAAETHTGQDAEGQAHKIKFDKGTGALADAIHQPVCLQHRKASRQGDEERSS
jgi:hypothetical protein